MLAIIPMILQVLLGLGGPLLQIGLKLIPILLEKKLLKEKEATEMTKKFQDAIEIAKKRADDPGDVHDQEKNAEDDAKKKWEQTKNTPPAP